MSGVFVSSNIIVIRTIQSRSLECILFKNEMTTTRTKDTTTAENESGGERESERKKDETQHIMYVEIDNCVLLSYNYITVVWSWVVAACAVLLLEWFRLVFASHTHTVGHQHCDKCHFGFLLNATAATGYHCCGSCCCFYYYTKLWDGYGLLISKIEFIHHRKWFGFYHNLTIVIVLCSKRFVFFNAQICISQVGLRHGYNPGPHNTNTYTFSVAVIRNERNANIEQ